MRADLGSAARGLALPAALLALVTAPGTAAACDPAEGAPKVSHGVSAGGVDWSQRASVSGGRLHLFVDFYEPYGDWGGGMSGAVPRRGAGILLVDHVDGLGQDRSESIVTGAAHRSVRRVEVTYDDGRTVPIRTHRASRRALRRQPGLRRVRFFARVASPSATLASAIGLDATGVAVARWPPATDRSLARAACLP